jgi:hypothetical protein
MPKPTENEFDIHAYRKFLMSYLPSQYLHNKIISENENENQKDSALASKKNRRKRHYPFVSDEPSSKRRKENLVTDNDTNVNDDVYKYANIITTRSGKQIKVPIRVKSKESDPKTKLNHELEMKSPKGGGKTAPLPGGKSISNTVSSNTSSKSISSKKESSFRMKNSNRLSSKGKFLKKTFHRPPPPEDSSSGEDDDDNDNDNDENDIDETETGSSNSNSYTSENSMSDKKVALKQRKQASNDLKKLLANKMNIIITMDHPSKAKASANKKKINGKTNDDLYTDDEEVNEEEYNEEDTYDEEDDYSEDDYDEDDDETDEEEDDEDNEDDEDSEDDYDDDDEDEDDDADDADDDEYDSSDKKSLSRNGSYNSLFSTGGSGNGVTVTSKDMSFASDPEFMKFIQRSPLSLVQGASDKEEKTMDILFSSIRDMYKADPENQILRAYYYQLKNSCNRIKKDKAKRVTKEKHKNCKEFKKLLRKRSSTNDLLYFKRHFSPEQQAKLIHEIKEVNKLSYSDVPYRLSVLQSSIPRMFKSIALNKISTLRNMDPGSGEFYKIKNWVDGFMKIPFDNEKKLPVTLETHGREACSVFMDSAKKQLDDAVYGLDDAKLQLMQLVGQWIANPQAIGTAVAIHGPPGTGKTSLIKDGVSKILGRDFAFIALGGATDSSFLEGHSYTYEGSTWGKIVDILIQCKSTNPVIYFDELDKISETPKGDEIVGILTHLTDTTQNSQFHDKYFSEIAFDLSKCLFIFSYNDESRVNRVLLDRMFRIRTSGYSAKEKVTITQNYLVPKIVEQVKFSPDDIRISSDMIEYIVENYTEKEEGVRNLKRCLEIIHTKLNLHRLMTPGTIVSMFPKEFKSNEVVFPFTVTRNNLEHLLKKNEVKLCYGMYV